VVEHSAVRPHLNARDVGERAEERARVVDLGRDGLLPYAFIEAALPDSGGLSGHRRPARYGHRWQPSRARPGVGLASGQNMHDVDKYVNIGSRGAE